MGYEIIVMICLAAPAVSNAANRTYQEPHVECVERGVLAFSTVEECNRKLNYMTKGGNFTFAYCQKRS